MLLGVACDQGQTGPEPPPGPVATRIDLSPTSILLRAIGETARVSATVFDQHGQTMQVAVTWSSSDDGVATVDASGLVAAAGSGSATVTATAGRASASVVVRVTQVAMAVHLEPDTLFLVALGDTASFRATVRDANGAVIVTPEVVWLSTDTLVAVVNSTGLATAIGNGTTSIAATADSVSAVGTVRVTQVATSVIVHPPADTIIPGDTVRLVAEAFAQRQSR